MLAHGIGGLHNDLLIVGPAAVALVAVRASTAGPAGAVHRRPRGLGQDPRRHRMRRRRPALVARDRDAARPEYGGWCRSAVVSVILAAGRGLAGGCGPGLDPLARRPGFDQHATVGHRDAGAGSVPGIKTVGTIVALGRGCHRRPAAAHGLARRRSTGDRAGAVRNGPAQPGGTRVVRPVVPADRGRLLPRTPRPRDVPVTVGGPRLSPRRSTPRWRGCRSTSPSPPSLVVGTVASVTWAVRPSARSVLQPDAGTRP